MLPVVVIYYILSVMFLGSLLVFNVMLALRLAKQTLAATHEVIRIDRIWNW
jgi:hypothetical protein